MVKYGILNWYYCRPGKWLTVTCTDCSFLESIVNELEKLLCEHAKIKYTPFSAGGGSITIQHCIFESLTDGSIEDYVESVFRRYDWEPDGTPYSYKRAI